MPVEIKRRPGENTYNFLRRFRDKVKKGRVLRLAKKNSYHQKSLSKKEKKERAKIRAYNRKHREYLIRTGQLEEDEKRFK